MSSAQALIERHAKEFDEALVRFQDSPSALWLIASASIEFLERLEKGLPQGGEGQIASLKQRAHAIRARAHPQISPSESEALSEWVDLAKKRALLEEKVRQAIAQLPHPIEDRHGVFERLSQVEEALEQHRGELQLESPPRFEKAALFLRALYPDYDPFGLPEEFVLARGKKAWIKLHEGHASKPSLRRFLFSSSFLLGAAYLSALISGLALFHFGALERLLAVFSVFGSLALAFGFLVAALFQRRKEIFERPLVLEVWGWRKRLEKKCAELEEEKERLHGVVLAIKELDKFSLSQEGRRLALFEEELPALAPWVRLWVGGFDGEESLRFTG
ncbi:MAG: hypothetical protein NZM37_06040 [Sandaracinaceae bacterium]|nr:hypothetical protein [Sandaracinaceae bacterium]MDW8245400.1 hypothetical protein [Sandaracinaceae bacterium]